jgi:hypothetical protein
VWLLQEAQVKNSYMWLQLAPSKGPNRVGVFPLTWGQKQIHFPKRSVFSFLEYRTMDKVQKLSNSEYLKLYSI